MTQNVKPTRSELMKLKNRIKLANSGYNLLKKKRDGLILSFFEMLKESKTIRQDLTEAYKDAFEKFNMARVIETDMRIKSLALSIPNRPEIEVKTKNIMGVTVPTIKSEDIEKRFDRKGYSVITTSAAVDESVSAYEELTKLIVKAAEVETAMKKLLLEIEKTKRRVNALEFEVIPKLEKTRAFIEFRLEEAERETIFRTKRIKKKSEELRRG
ncbi:V-type ATP synthase subunit D [Candidatus Woesearchaeota archaeon]|nr:V-type ATP synthase subunit D [Candidatus Woesearchaeota archaeon]